MRGDVRSHFVVCLGVRVVITQIGLEERALRRPERSARDEIDRSRAEPERADQRELAGIENHVEASPGSPPGHVETQTEQRS